MNVSEYQEGIQRFKLEEYEKEKPYHQRVSNCFKYATEGNYQNFTRVTFKFGVAAAKSAAVCTGICAVIGAIIAFITGWWNTWMGAKKGALIGAIIAPAVAFHWTVVDIEFSNHYRAWKGKTVEKEVSKIFDDYIYNDRVLKNYICPVSGELIKIPVKGPDGVLYDHQGFCDYIKNKPQGRPASIYNQKDFDESKLEFHPKSFKRIVSRIIKLANRELGRKDLDEKKSAFIKDGLLACLKTYDDFIVNLRNDVRKQYSSELDASIEQDLKKSNDRAGIIRKHTAVYDEKIKSLNKCFEPLNIQQFQSVMTLN